MKTKILFFLILFAQAEIAFGSFFDKLTIRKSFDSKNDKAEAAIFTYTHPKENPESWLLDVALGYDLTTTCKEILTIDPFFEIHRNTLTDKKQYTYQSGLSLEWQIKNMVNKKWSPILIFTPKYSSDQLKMSDSFKSNLYFTPLFKGRGLKAKWFWMPSISTNVGNIFQFSYTPYVGFENENNLKSNNDSLKGSSYRFIFKITSTLSLFPKSSKLKEKFDFTFDWQYRNTLANNILVNNKNELHYFSTGFNYTIYNTEKLKKFVKIGIDYTNGENPDKDFKEQSYYALSIKVKL